MKKVLKIRIKNDIKQLADVTEATSVFYRKWQIPERVASSIDLALDEIINNIILYGYQDFGEHYIDVSIYFEKNYAVVEIVDDGREFNPLDVPIPDMTSEIEERPVGGLGIHLVRNMMDEIKYDRKEDKNYIFLKKKVLEV